MCFLCLMRGFSFVCFFYRTLRCRRHFICFRRNTIRPQQLPSLGAMARNTKQIGKKPSITVSCFQNHHHWVWIGRKFEQMMCVGRMNQIRRMNYWSNESNSKKVYTYLHVELVKNLLIITCICVYYNDMYTNLLLSNNNNRLISVQEKIITSHRWQA